MTATDEILARFPRVHLLPTASGVQRLRRLEQVFGNGVEIYIKRDDALRPFCGNKLRYIEFILGAAHAEGADCLLHCGGATSNYMAQLAIIGAERGLPVNIALQAGPEAAAMPNPTLIALHGGRIRYVGNMAGGEAKAAWAADIRAAGGRPYVIGPPFSNHSAILGFLAAAQEIQQQHDCGMMPPVDSIYMCSAGNSYLGLRLGAHLTGAHFEIRAFSPIRFADTQLTDLASSRNAFLHRKLSEFASAAGLPLPEISIDVSEGMVGPGYGVPTPEALEAIRLVARLEGIALDPVYTGKAAAALIADLRAGIIKPGQRVLFWHSGGAANLFSPALMQA
jgi:1-aminocyclopropane-1-carboxylate deaminase/D-cysteine desulfhydrase-like pyridoxal-dependent ACC family enzyme